jgi:excisionase family DNA binding protein
MRQQDVEEEPLISQAKAAELCGMTREAIRKLVAAGRLKASEVGGRELVYLKEVEALSRERQADFA